MKEVVQAVALIIGAVILIGLILAYPTMWLWNATCPHLFHLPVLDFWDALFLNLLCGILSKNTSYKSKES
jgi:hypothetical protein